MKFNREVRGRKGFSLIELLVTVTIMLLLVGVAAFYLEDYVYKSKVSKAQQDLDMFRSAINMRDAIETKPFSTYNYNDESANAYFYSWNTSSVAGFQDTWGTFGCATTAWSNYATNSLGNLIGTYLKNVPKDPWGMPYIVNTAAGFISALGTDMKFSTACGTAGITESGREKDIVAYYLGDKLILTDVVVTDTNNDGSIQAGEYIDFKFNKDVQLPTAGDLVAAVKLCDSEVTPLTTTTLSGVDTTTSFSAVGKMKDNGRVLRCVFNEDHPASSIIGQWASFNTDDDTGLSYNINSTIFDMDPYVKNPTGSKEFGRPITSTNNPARQIRFELVW